MRHSIQAEVNVNKYVMKKALRGDENTARWLRVRPSQKFRPGADPHTGGTGRPKFNQLEMVTTFTYKPSLVRIDACNFKLLWKQTHTHTHR